MKGHVTGCAATTAAPPASSPACARQTCMLGDHYVRRDTHVLRYRAFNRSAKRVDAPVAAADSVAHKARPQWVHCVQRRHWPLRIPPASCEKTGGWELCEAVSSRSVGSGM